MYKIVYIHVSFLQLGFLGKIFVLFFFISIVTSCDFLLIPPGAVLVTIPFLVGLCALLSDVGFSFITHLLHLAWVEVLFEVLAVHYIEEQAIGAPITSAFAPTTQTTASPSSAMSSSVNFIC